MITFVPEPQPFTGCTRHEITSLDDVPRWRSRMAESPLGGLLMALSEITLPTVAYSVDTDTARAFDRAVTRYESALTTPQLLAARALIGGYARAVGDAAAVVGHVRVALSDVSLDMGALECAAASRVPIDVLVDSPATRLCVSAFGLSAARDNRPSMMAAAGARMLIPLLESLPTSVRVLRYAGEDADQLKARSVTPGADFRSYIAYCDWRS